MHLQLKTKITFLIALLVLAVVGVSSWLYIAALTSQAIRQADYRAEQVPPRILSEARNALADAASAGLKPASSRPEDQSAYVREVLQQSGALISQINAEAANPQIYEVSIVDRDGPVLLSSDSSLLGQPALPRQPLRNLVNASFLRQLLIIYGPPQTYDVSSSFVLGPPEQQMPFGEIRVSVQERLLRDEITPALTSAGLLALTSVLLSVLFAAVVSSILLRPVGGLSAQLDRIERGEVDPKPLERADEFGQVSTKISQIGLQLRGVREIFSSLREDTAQILAGIDDGLLLFTRDGRASMVSPAVEHFLGVSADHLLGCRAGEIFPPDHPLRAALGLSGDVLKHVAAAEIEMAAAQPDSPPRRIGVSVQVNAEGGALVRLRDLESIDRINSQLQVSENLSALGRMTRGVAHEVKNPLNSMRIWLENLKESLPAGEEMPRQAVAVLDSEIDRLDSVVKRLLDFMSSPDLRLEETSLDALLAEIISVSRPQMERSGVHLVTNFANLPPVRVDQALLKQALLNLVFNAIEAMPQGGTLTLDLERCGKFAEIRIADTGPGIAPEHRARIFQLFFTTRPGGSGIGLAIACKTVHLHEGTIDFDSEIGRGTTFRIELPLVRPLEHSFSRSHDTSGAVVGNV